MPGITALETLSIMKAIPPTNTMIGRRVYMKLTVALNSTVVLWSSMRAVLLDICFHKSSADFSRGTFVVDKSFGFLFIR